MASYARPFKQCGADPDLVDRTSTRAMMLLIAARGVCGKRSGIFRSVNELEGGNVG